MDYRDIEANISKLDINGVINGVTNWVKENREVVKDPNAFELVNIFLFAGKYAKEGELIDKDSLKQLWEMRSKDFANCNINEKHFVYKICEDSYLSAIEDKPLVDDPMSHIALRKTASIGLFIMQQQRDTEEVNYNNEQELLQVLKTSNILKENYPQEFEKYQVNNLCQLLTTLQPEDKLSDFTKTQIETFSKQLTSKTSTSTNKTI